MYCRHCGRQIPDGSVFCPVCGMGTAADVEVKTDYNAAPQPASNSGSASALSIVGFVLSFFITIAGLICSIIAYSNAKRDNDQKSRPFAIAGIAISSVEIGLSIILFIFVFSVWADTFNALMAL